MSEKQCDLSIRTKGMVSVERKFYEKREYRCWSSNDNDDEDPSSGGEVWQIMYLCSRKYVFENNQTKKNVPRACPPASILSCSVQFFLPPFENGLPPSIMYFSKLLNEVLPLSFKSCRNLILKSSLIEKGVTPHDSRVDSVVERPVFASDKVSLLSGKTCISSLFLR